MNLPELIRLLQQCIQAPNETEWIEFKENRADPEEIGEYLAAISNSAALHGKEAGFIIWGVRDGTRVLVGTDFRPRETRVGNEELECWLGVHLHPRINFRIHEFAVEGRSIVIFEVPKAAHTPVRFRDTEFVRVRTYKKKLKDYPEKERELWGSVARVPFERAIAARSLAPDEVLKLIDYPAYFELTNQSLPDGRSAILDRLASERLIIRDGDDRFHITNLGAILFAKTLASFDNLARKAVRVIVYRARNRVETLREDPGGRGYAAGFESLIHFINSQLPQNEHIGRALRAEVRMYPELAVRELVANALIHQDFWMTGTGPMVEIFTDRIEITNPGTPLIDPMRFIDQPPRSRNEDLAGFMRRLNICEERGSGIDKAIFHIEVFQLPAPDFSVAESHTRAVLFAYQTLAQMAPQDRVRACYQHAGLQWVSNDQMTNASLRKRFGIKDQNSAQASRIIRETLEARLIKEYDPANTSRRHSRYVPFWA